jgi:microcystin degradation protein MlrC
MALEKAALSLHAATEYKAYDSSESDLLHDLVSQVRKDELD